MGFLGTFATACIACFIIGLVLIVIELFTPGMGVAGFSGIACFVAVIVMQFLGNDSTAAWIVTAIVILITVGLFAFMLRSFQSGKLSKSKLILHESIDANSSPIAEDATRVQMGEIGTTLTPLRPSGIALFGDRRINVSSFGNFIAAGKQVSISAIEGMNIWVRELSAPQSTDH